MPSQNPPRSPVASLLGPILFIIYMLPIGLLIRKHGIQFHCYIDDTQIYIKTTPDSLSSINTLTSCLDDIKAWMSNRSEMANRQYFIIVKEDDPLNSIFGPQQEPVNFNT